MRLTPSEAFAFAGFCRNWPTGRPAWHAGGGDLDAAIEQPERADPFVGLAVFRNGGSVDITADQVAEAFGLVAEAFVTLTRCKGLVGELNLNPQRLAKVFDAYAATPAQPVAVIGDAFEPAPRVPTAGIVGPKRAAFGGGR